MEKVVKSTHFIEQDFDILKDKEYRCPVCRRLLMRGQVILVETRCPKCRKIITIHK